MGKSIEKKVFTFFILPAFMLFFTPVLQAQSGGVSGVPKKSYWWFEKDTVKLVQEAKPVILHPPVFGKKRRNNGMILPLPFGVGVSFFKFEQPYVSRNLEISNFKNDIVIKAEVVRDNTDIGEISTAFKPDFWLFPFLNVYGLFGYTSGYNHRDITVEQFTAEGDGESDLVGDSSFRLVTNPDYSGKVLGFGTTVSTGFKSYFIMLNYEFSKTGRVDYKEKLTYQYFRAKLGVLLGHNNQKAKGTFWLGTSYMHDEHSFEGLVFTQDILPGNEQLLGEMLMYTGTDRVAYPWNLLFGGTFDVNDHHIVVLELGVIHRKQLNFSYTFRF